MEKALLVLLILEFQPKRTTNLAIACGNSRFLQSVTQEINRILIPNKGLFNKDINIHPIQISARISPMKGMYGIFKHFLKFQKIGFIHIRGIHIAQLHDLASMLRPCKN